MFNKTNKIMSLFDEASLVVTPNGYKEGKLYSIKPTDGSGDLDVVRATTATRVNSDGLIESVDANVPRLDYTNGSCPSILVEPQRTNLALRSEEFDNANWSKINSNISQNSTISPSGVLDADLLTSTSNSVTSNLHQTISIPSGSATFSVFAKAGNYNIFRIANASSSQRAAWFDLSTGSVIGTVNGGTASVENFGNGWFRCIFTANSVASGSLAFIISISSEANLTNAVAGANIYFWGAQLEAGSYATSYIPTVASAVTRNADVISKTGISDLIGQTEGTIYLETKLPQEIPSSSGYFSISDGTANNSYIVQFRNNGTLRIYQNGLDGSNLAFVDSNINLSQNNKIAFKYEQSISSMTLYVNGVEISLQGSFVYENTVGINSIKMAYVTDALNLYSEIKEVKIYNTALTDLQLQQLTTI